MTDLAAPVSLHSLDELRDYIHQALCRRENLLVEQSPLSETPLLRAGGVCGIQFTVHGPRAVRLSAIWAADLNVIYLYDARGERYLKVPLRYRLKRMLDAA